MFSRTNSYARRASIMQENLHPVFTFTSSGSTSGPSVSNPNLSKIDIHEEFVNIVTESTSMYRENNFLYHDYQNNNDGMEYFEYQQPYRRFASAAQLLQVPSYSSAWHLPEENSLEYDESGRTRQTRSRSVGTVTVSTQYNNDGRSGRTIQKYGRRCSSASPKGRNHQRYTEQQTCNKYRGDLTPPRARKRRSSCYRRASNHSMTTPLSSSSSSLGTVSPSSISPRRLSPSGRRHRAGSVPNSTNSGSNSNNSSNVSGTTFEILRAKTPSPSRKHRLEHATATSHKSNSRRHRHSCFYDVVILGSSNVGKSSLAECFNNGDRYMTSSGSDQGIGSEEDDDEQQVCYEDEDDDELSPGKAIIYKPNRDLGQTCPNQQFNFALRIFHEQDTAVNHTYKYDAVLIVYSVIDRKSFEYARKILNTMKKEWIINGGGGKNKRVVILVGNKKDLERSRSVSTTEGEVLAAAHDCKFIEVSNSLDVGIESLKTGLCMQVYLRLQSKYEINNTCKINRNDEHGSNTRKKSFGCEKKGWMGNRMKHRKGSLIPPGASFKMAQKMFDKIVTSLGGSANPKSKSCLDLYSL